MINLCRLTSQAISCILIDKSYLFTFQGRKHMIIHQEHNSLGNHNYNAFFYDNCDWFNHFHKNYELVHVLDGEVVLTLNGSQFLLKQGDFALVFPNEFHSYHTPTKSYVWIGVFSSDFVGEFAKLTATKRAKTPVFVCDLQIQEFIKTYLIKETTPDTFLLKSTLYAVCREFFQKVPLYDAEKEKNFIYDIIAYMEKNFQKEISLMTIAEEFGYEYHYLSRQFHQHFHMNFKQFLNIYRADYARDQLLHTNASITDIAHSSGFQTVRTFNRVFLEQTGMTPSAYRDQG